MKRILFKILLILVLSTITAILDSAFEDYRIKTTISIFYGYYSCYILNYENLKMTNKKEE